MPSIRVLTIFEEAPFVGPDLLRVGMAVVMLLLLFVELLSQGLYAPRGPSVS